MLPNAGSSNLRTISNFDSIFQCNSQNLSSPCKISGMNRNLDTFYPEEIAPQCFLFQNLMFCGSWNLNRFLHPCNHFLN